MTQKKNLIISPLEIIVYTELSGIIIIIIIDDDDDRGVVDVLLLLLLVW
jgi:hypothetical protein